MIVRTNTIAKNKQMNEFPHAKWSKCRLCISCYFDKNRLTITCTYSFAQRCSRLQHGPKAQLQNVSERALRSWSSSRAVACRGGGAGVRRPRASTRGGSNDGVF